MMWSQELPVNIGKLGFGWSETIGETVVDLDARWYNSAWRSLARTPVETRSLYSDESVNLKGQLEMFIDIFDAKEVDKRPKMFRPVPISKPPQMSYEMRVVVYKIMDCVLPYRLAKNDPAKLCAFYVQARLGNRSEDEKRTDTCKYVADGVAEFNWRLKWSLQLPSLDVKPRLKLQIFDDTSLGLGSDQLCAVADIKLRSLFDEIVTTRQPIIKKKQWVNMEHPNHPDVQTRIQVSFELTTAEMAAKKKCFEGRGGYKETQHQDYVLPVPFRPAAFSLYNPVPYFNYLIISSIQNLQWSLATVLLIFPFIPMFVQFVFMLTPWQWYAAGGVCGLLVLIRLSMVSASRTARMQAEVEAATVIREEEERRIKGKSRCFSAEQHLLNGKPARFSFALRSAHDMCVQSHGVVLR
ncbi:Ferlin [Gracilaria domingensis]|nr:Ferlin [Gracilaria domingensis]